MADVSAIRAGLATRLVTITGLRVHTQWPDQISCPAAIVKPDRMDYHDTFSGTATIHFEVILLAGPAKRDLKRSQALLDAYLDESGASSVLAAIEGGKTLGGEADDLVVTDWHDYGSVEVGGTEYIGVIFAVQVFA